MAEFRVERAVLLKDGSSCRKHVFRFGEYRRPARREHVDPFSVGELRAILAAAPAVDPDLAVALELWMECGLRSGELTGLRPEDVDLDGGGCMCGARSRGRSGSTKTGREGVVAFGHPILEDAHA